MRDEMPKRDFFWHGGDVDLPRPKYTNGTEEEAKTRPQNVVRREEIERNWRRGDSRKKN